MLAVALFNHFASAANQSSESIWALDILGKVICELNRSKPLEAMS
jgi:hypothetical protein